VYDPAVERALLEVVDLGERDRSLLDVEHVALAGGGLAAARRLDGDELQVVTVGLIAMTTNPARASASNIGR